MGKKIMALILSVTITSSMIACSSNNKDSKAAKESTSNTTSADKDLSGTWAQGYTRDQVKELYNGILAKVEETAAEYGLEYEVKEEIKDENGTSVNDNYINLNIENPELNRLESLYFGFRQKGSDLASGGLSMKLSSNLDKDAILEAGNYNFAETSFAAFSEDFTGNSERDYTDLNKKIYEIISGNNEVETIENNLEGIRETISITDNFLLYKLETKEYNFK